MRIVLLSATAIALSGCSLLGGQSSNHSGASYGHNSGTYQTQQTVNRGQKLSRFNIEGGAGVELMGGADFLDADDAIAAGGFTPNDVSMKTAYKTGTRYDVGASYAINPNLKLTATGYQNKHKGKRILVDTDAGGNQYAGTPSDYKATGLEAGLRQYALPVKAPLVKSIRPYIEGRVGAAKVDDITLEDSTFAGAALPDVQIYDGGWVPTGAGLIGVETSVFNRFTMGVETGIRYTGKLDGVSAGAFSPGGGSEGANSGSDKWSVPVMLRGRFRF